MSLTTQLWSLDQSRIPTQSTSATSMTTTGSKSPANSHPVRQQLSPTPWHSMNKPIVGTTPRITLLCPRVTNHQQSVKKDPPGAPSHRYLSSNQPKRLTQNQGAPLKPVTSSLTR